MVRLAAIATAVSLITGVCAADVRLSVGGATVTTSPAPALDQGTLVAPWAAVVKATGLTAAFDRHDNSLRLMGVQKTPIVLTADGKLTVGDRTATLSPRPRVAGEDLVAPIKPLCQALEWNLDWTPTTSSASIWSRIVGLVTRGDEDGAYVSVLTSLPTTGTLTQLDGPVRTSLDLSGTLLGVARPLNYINLAGVQRVRTAQFSKNAPVVRVVLDLAGSGDRGRWEPRPDRCGGKLIVGTCQGDEPVVQRVRARLLRVAATASGRDQATVTATFTDPVSATYDVLRQPYRVLLDLGGADTSDAQVTVATDCPFVESARVLPEGRLAVYLNEMAPFGVRALTQPDRLVLTVRRERLQGKTIVVDAGHGGEDSGARGRYTLEKTINLDVAQRTATRLALMNARPILTRDSDVFVDLYARPRLTNSLRADLFVSIHCNAFKPDKGSGTQTYYCTPQSKALGIVMQDALWPQLGRRDGGVHQARFCVIRETQIPAVLVELLFVDNKVEEDLLAKPETRQRAAMGICEGLRQYLEGTSSVAPAVLAPETEG